MNKKKLWLALSVAGLVVVAGFGARAFLKRRLAATQQVDKGNVVAPRKVGPIERAEVLYDGKLGQGWDDWGWGPHEINKGPAKIGFAGYGGILLRHDELPWQYGGLSFRYQAPEDWGEFMHVSLRATGLPDDAFPVVAVHERHVVPVGTWREVLIDGQELNPEGRPFDRVMIGSRTSVGDEPVLLDQIVFTQASPGAAANRRDPVLEVLCAATSHPISEWIYGGSTDDFSAGISSKRIGGNPLSRANWENGTWNAGHDWFFENGGQKTTLLEVIKNHGEEGIRLAMVVPMLGWVSKDSSSFSFPRSKFPEQEKFDPYKPDAGNGNYPDGKPIPPGDPSETSVPAPPELIQKWLSKVGEASPGKRPVHMYILDNEPALWNVTHRDVHPQPVGYDELLDRTIKYASAVRAADPQAVIAGPAEWGWINYISSAIDRDAVGGQQPDRKKHGDVPLVAWYLRQLAAHERSTGVRLLDVLDLHFYPAADGMYGGNARTDPASADKRIRSTRGLWDPRYQDESWIKEAIRLIPRMREWVRDNYPGRKLSIGEWSFGADDHISGGLATAEALGRFGQHQLDYAFYWGELKESNANYWAFRAFRNFDGKGARFLDLSLPVKESETVSLFASSDTARKRVVLVLVNRDATAKANVSISFPGCGRVTESRLFGFEASSKTLTAGESSITSSGVSAVLAPYSFAVLDLKLE